MRINALTLSSTERPSLEQAALSARAKVFVDREVAAALTSPLGTILLAWAQAKVTGWERAVLWLCAINLAEMLVLGIGYRFRLAQSRGENVLPWVDRMILALFLTGLIWGSSVWVFWTEGQYLHYLLNLTLLVGVAGICVVLMSPFRMAGLLFNSGVLLLPVLHLAYVPNQFGVEIAVGLTIMFALALQYGRMAELLLIDSIRGTLRTERLLEDLAHRSAALEESQSELHRAQAVGHVGSWVYDLATDSMRLSAETCRIFGLPEDTKGSHDTYLARVHPDDRERLDRAWQIALAGGKPFDDEHRILVGNTTRWVRQKAELERGPDGALVRSVGTAQDVTERRTVEEAIKLSEERLRTIIETEPECVKVVDHEGRLVEMNAAGLAMIEADSLAQAQQCPLVNYLLPEHRNAFIDLHRRVMQGHNGVLAFEVEGLKGTRRWLETHAAPMHDSDANVVALLGVTRDITEQKWAEAERIRLETQLRESQKMEALGTMAGGVAHDFNNALATIIGNVELARQDVGPDHPALESLDEIGKASRRAKDLVQQILSFSRRQKLERKATSLALVALETARMVRAMLPAMVRLKVSCEPDTPAVSADATQIKQILLNLCGNAIQAIQDQGSAGRIEIQLRAHEPEVARAGTGLKQGRYARLSVCDTGPGMDAATKSRIFEPFFTTKPPGKGTGLGLAVVHGIVRAHGATIEVESAPGKGSEFHVYFPAIDATLADTEIGASSVEASQADGNGKRVLYVDDEEAIIFLMRRLLERKGFRFSGYTDPRAALAAFRADPGQFDLAVTDYNMPEMTGLDVAMALREIRVDLPVVLASGYITEELRQKAPDAGIRELIYKPNTVDDLCEAVARYANANN